MHVPNNINHIFYYTFFLLKMAFVDDSDVKIYFN